MKQTKKGKTHPTLQRQRVFLETFAAIGNVTLAAQAARIDPHTHYNWLQDPEYRQRFEIADNTAVDLMVEEARKRAIQGDPEPALYQGALCYESLPNGKKRQIVINRKSDNLLMFLLKSRRPEIFRDSFKGEIKHTAIVSQGPDLSKLSEEQLQALEEMSRLAQSSTPTETSNGTDEEDKSTSDGSC